MICTVICTRERPKMLRRMLESCINITADDRSDMIYIIVENGPAEQAQEIVTAFSDRLNIQYVHEPKVGIVNARNKGIEAFLESGADWMASFDDDEEVSSEWLREMLNAITAHPFCKIFSGPQFRTLPDGANKWLAAKLRPNPVTGTIYWNVSTANTLFRREVFAEDNLNLRFHPLFNLSGGEDTYLFHQLKDLREPIIWVREAECFEPMTPIRTTFEARLKRNIQVSQNWAKMKKLRFGRVAGTTLVAITCLGSAVNFVVFGVVGGGVYVLNKNAGFHILNFGLKMGTETIGHFKGLFFQQGELYAEVQGE